MLFQIWIWKLILQFDSLFAKVNFINLKIVNSNDCINEKTKLKKWSLLSFSKKPKSTINLQKEVEGANLSENGINQVKQLVEYLSKEQSK